MPNPSPLEDPPITEVVCGIVFERVPELDILLLGAFGLQRQSVFPKRSVQASLDDAPGVRVSAGIGPLRAWFQTADMARLLQIQHDRFYLNWRNTGVLYPRFSSDEGLGAQCLSEFEHFTRFCEATLSVTPQPRRVELSKVDLLKEGLHWDGLDELETIVPCLAVFRELGRVNDSDFDLTLTIPEARGHSLLKLQLVAWERKRALRIDTHRALEVDASYQVKDALWQANAELNKVFFNILSPLAKTRFSED